MQKPLLICLALVVSVLSLAFVASKATTFSLKDPKSVNSMRFTLDARIEQISGVATGIEGDFTFDAEDVAATRGKVIVQAASLETNLENMSEHMRGPMWLDAEKYPTIEFEIKKIAKVKKLDTDDPTWSMSVTGDFTLHGVTKSITIPVKLTYLPGQLRKRNRRPGDLIVLRSTFEINRMDFGVEGNQTLDIVSDVVKIEFSIGSFARSATE